MLGGSEPGRRQGLPDEGVTRPDGRRHPQGDQLLGLGFGIHVVNGSDLQVDPAVAEGGPRLQLLGPEPQ